MNRTAFFAALLMTAASMAWAGDKLEIVKAEYGAQDKWTDVTEKVKSKVADNTLKIEANNNLCPDPAPKIPKTLKITAKAGDKLAIFHCAERKSIEINPEKVAAAAKGIVIISATYGTQENNIDVTKKVQDILMQGNKRITPSNTLFGDPAKGKAKTLIIKYQSDGKDTTVSIAEKETAELL